MPFLPATGIAAKKRLTWRRHRRFYTGMKTTIIGALGALLLLFSPTIAQYPPAGPPITNDTDSLLNAGMDELLADLLLTHRDFTFRDDYTDVDSFRLAIVDSLMRRPLLLRDFAADCSQRLGRFADTPDTALVHLDRLMGEGRRSPTNIGDRKPVRIDLGKLDKSLRTGMERLAGLIESAQSRLDGAMQGWPDGAREFVATRYREMILEDPADMDRSIEEIDSAQQAEEEYTRQFAQMALTIADAPPVELEPIAACLDGIGAVLVANPSLMKKAKPGKPLFTADSPYGRIAVGSYGNDVYDGDFFIIIDPGGEDVYRLTYDVKRPHPVIIADFSGNDIYTAKDEFALACGALAYSILIDYDGDDVYRGGSFSLGTGYFGIGILWDKNGDDQYYGDTFTEGAGTFGIGLLIDSDGADTYTGNMNCQGFGFVRGVGGVIDYAGNDTYTVSPKYTDVLRYDDHYISLSQGFAYGLRPLLSGGLGFICDYAGNDVYVSDIFGQGSSYWWALGVLIDEAGNDQYLSYQYAQGAGAHMTLGILFDRKGNDMYRAHGVSQGCGHDYSCGWLCDMAGDDIYSSYDLSQGAGSANGFGILTDVLGSDGYYVFLKGNSQGYGNPRRDYGSIGLFLDLDGADRYDGNGVDNSFWRTVSKWGGGLDRAIPTPDTTEGK